MSYDDMLAAARETVKPGLNPFDALLPEQPGVRRSRQAFISGVRANLPPFECTVLSDLQRVFQDTHLFYEIYVPSGVTGALNLHKPDKY